MPISEKTNGDSVNIPSEDKLVYGKLGILTGSYHN